MNESILLEFRRGSDIVPVTSFRTTAPRQERVGLVLDGETGAWPRGIAIRLRARSNATDARLLPIRKRHGWLNPKRFEVEVARDGSGLRLSGVEDDALPAGDYELALRIGGLTLDKHRVTLRLRKHATRRLVVGEKRPTRRFVANRPLAAYDKRSFEIITHPKSDLDGRTAADWLTQTKHRDSRKACLLNILARLAVTPTLDHPLNRHVQRLLLADIDRVYAAVRPAFLERLHQSRLFRRDGTVAATHKKLLTWIGDPDSRTYELRSYRERATPSMQAVVAVPKRSSERKTHFVDLDFDLGNPVLDLKSFFVHLGELLDGKKTDHLKLWKKLARTNAAPFLYYTAEQV